MRAPRWTVVLTAATTVILIASMVAVPISLAAPMRTSTMPAAAGGAQPAIPATTCSESAGTRTCHLWADEGTLSLQGGGSVPILGYALGTSGAPGGPATLPGPVLVANVGETVELVLHNELADPTSLTVRGNDSFPGDMVGAPAGGSNTYAFEADRPGTFIYEAGLTDGGDKQVAMGLYGALVVRPASATTAYGAGTDTTFDQEELLLFSEIDPALHTNPAAFNMRDYHPTYWLINGSSFPASSGISTTAGTNLLIRWVNAGLVNQAFGSSALYERVVGIGGYRLPHDYSVLAETLPAGTTLDGIAVIPSVADGTQIPIGSAALHLDNAGVGVAGGPVPFGGMLAFLTVGAGPDTSGPSTTLALSAPLTNDSTSVTLDATGNDAGSGGSDVDAARYFVDAACVDGAGAAMAPAGPPATSLSFSATLGVLAEGDHAITAQSHDAAGNWGACSSPSVLRVDTTDPIASGASASPDPTDGAPNVTLTASATDPDSGGVNSGIAAGEWFEDPLTAEGAGTPMAAADTMFDNATEGLTATVSVVGLSTGSHTLYVRAMDGAGNWGAATSATFTVNDALFVDGFESGSIAAWSGVTGLSDSAVTAGSAMAGSTRGMNVSLSGGTAAYLTDTTPANETSYHARFYFNPHTWQKNSAGSNGEHAIFVGRNSANQTLFVVQSRKTGKGNGGAYQVRLLVSRTGGTTNTNWYGVINPNAHAIEIAWQGATGASASLWIDGALMQTLTGLNTNGRTLDKVELGVQSLPSAASGSVYFDEFRSSRFAYIGP